MRRGRLCSGEIAVHIKRNNKQRLVLVDFPFMAAVAVLIPTVGLLYVVVVLAGDWGARCAFLVFIILWDALLLLFVKRSVFDFDLVERRLLWNRRSIYRNRGGMIPFAKIRGVTVDVLSGDGTSYRLVLTTERETIPMMASYTGQGRPSVAKELGRIAAVVNAALKTNPAVEMEDKILELASSGNYVAAVQMARQRYGDDLNQARRFVDELMKKMPDQGK
jgi:hypothetical protein